MLLCYQVVVSEQLKGYFILSVLGLLLAAAAFDWIMSLRATEMPGHELPGTSLYLRGWVSIFTSLSRTKATNVQDTTWSLSKTYVGTTIVWWSKSIKFTECFYIAKWQRRQRSERQSLPPLKKCSNQYAVCSPAQHLITWPDVVCLHYWHPLLLYIKWPSFTHSLAPSSWEKMALGSGKRRGNSSQWVGYCLATLWMNETAGST